MAIGLRLAAMARRAASLARCTATATAAPLEVHRRTTTATPWEVCRCTPGVVPNIFSRPACDILVGKSAYSTSSNTFGPIGPDGLPVSVDWRERGAVTEVSDQGNCGSCWSFACTATVEGINAIYTHKLIKLSEQQLIDCVDVNCNGCNGGNPESAFQYIIDNGGQVPYDDYPSVGFKNDVYKPVISMGVTIDNYGYTLAGDEDLLKSFVAVQPVVVAVGADYYFLGYKDGVIDGKNYTIDEMSEVVNGSPLGHWVTVVGYGETDHGEKFWQIKNSYGRHFGLLGGYVLVARDTPKAGGAFGISRIIAYPLKHSHNRICRVRSETDMGVKLWGY